MPDRRKPVTSLDKGREHELALADGPSGCAHDGECRCAEMTLFLATNLGAECKQCRGMGSYQMFDRPEPGFGRLCAPCGGTGKVWPLRVKCWVNPEYPEHSSKYGGIHLSEGCPGWVPDVTMPKLLLALHEAGYCVEVNWRAGESAFVSVGHTRSPEYADRDDPFEALLVAAEAAGRARLAKEVQP
mgnify:CR=1 FL=1